MENKIVKIHHKNGRMFRNARTKEEWDIVNFDKHTKKHPLFERCSGCGRPVMSDSVELCPICLKKAHEEEGKHEEDYARTSGLID